MQCLSFSFRGHPQQGVRSPNYHPVHRAAVGQRIDVLTPEIRVLVANQKYAQNRVTAKLQRQLVNSKKAL